MNDRAAQPAKTMAGQATESRPAEKVECIVEIVLGCIQFASGCAVIPSPEHRLVGYLGFTEQKLHLLNGLLMDDLGTSSFPIGVMERWSTVQDIITAVLQLSLPIEDRIETRVNRVIAAKTGVRVESFTSDSEIVADLNGNLALIIDGLQEEFKIEITLDDYGKKLLTVFDLVEAVLAAL